MLDRVMARRFQDGKMAGQVGALISEGVFKRIPNAGLSGEMHDPPDAVRSHDFVDKFGISDIAAYHFKSGPALEASGARLFQGWVIVIVIGVNAHDGSPFVEKPLGNVHTDESRRTGNEGWCAHFGRPTPT